MSEKPDQLGMMRYATVGMEFILTFGLFLLIGLVLDRGIGTLPAFTVLGAVVGFAGAIYRLVKQAKRIGRNWRRNDNSSADG